MSIPRKQFTKPYIRNVSTAGNKREERMKYGLVHIRYGDLKLVNKIKEWINELTTQGSVPKWSNGAGCQKGSSR